MGRKEGDRCKEKPGDELLPCHFLVSPESQVDGAGGAGEAGLCPDPSLSLWELKVRVTIKMNIF